MNLTNLQKLVSFNTQSNNSNLPLIDFCQKIFESSGYTIYKWGKGNKANLFAYKAIYGRKIILSAHSDTVPPVIGWQSDPFVLTQSKKSLTGLGVTDMKTFIAIMLEIAKNPDKQNLAFLLTFNEETDFAGAKLVDNKIIRKNDVIIIGEPTDNKFVLAAKGLSAYTVNFQGVAAHGSEPENGMSAIVDAAYFISILANNFNKIMEKYGDTSYQNQFPTLNFGTVCGGSAINIVAESAKIELEIRTTHDQTKKAFNSLMDNAIKSLKSKIAIKNNISVSPYISSLEVEYLSKIAPCQKGASYCTEANIYNKLCNNIIIFGPGQCEQAHKPNEFIEIKSVDEYLKYLTSLINMLS